jgi:hypothetical protein
MRLRFMSIAPKLPPVIASTTSNRLLFPPEPFLISIATCCEVSFTV